MVDVSEQVSVSLTGTGQTAAISIPAVHWFDVSVTIGGANTVVLERREVLPENVVGDGWKIFDTFTADTEEKGRNASTMEVRGRVSVYAAGTVIIRIRKGNP